MKVWERFFENALMGVDFQLEDEGEDNYRGYHDCSDPYKNYDIEIKEHNTHLSDVLFRQDFSNQTSLYPSETKDYDYNFCHGFDTSKVSYEYNAVTGKYREVYDIGGEKAKLDSIYNCAAEWFSWVLTYEHDLVRRATLAGFYPG